MTGWRLGGTEGVDIYAVYSFPYLQTGQKFFSFFLRAPRLEINNRPRQYIIRLVKELRGSKVDRIYSIIFFIASSPDQSLIIYLSCSLLLFIGKSMEVKNREEEKPPFEKDTSENMAHTL